ncbi:hypothetical protein BDQ17DRAFT_1258978, partial [Cyathus striatus]
TWKSTNLPWPHISIGLLMGIALAEIKSLDGEMLHAPTRLFHIIVSEASHLIWKLCCNWRIGDEADPEKIPSPPEIKSKWLRIINICINNDRILTDSRAYGKRAIKRTLVQSTWQRVLEDNLLIDPLPDNWLSRAGVLRS